MENTQITFEFNGTQITINTKYSYTCEKNVILRGSVNFTPLMYLVKHYTEYYFTESLNEYILVHKEEINKQNEKGYTALMLACIDNKKSYVEMLIRNGADINLRDISGNNALIYACFYASEEIVKMLIDAGSDINVQNNLRFTPLHAAILNKANREIKIILLLINNGINLKLRYGFESICELRSKDLIIYCFSKHSYYDENDLVKCIGVTKHKQLIASYLADIYLKKAGCLRSY